MPGDARAPLGRVRSLDARRRFPHRALSAGPGAARALSAGGTGRLEIALGAGGYVRLGDDGWVLVATPRSPAGPLSLLVAGLGPAPAVPGWPARVERGMLLVGPWRIALAGAVLPRARPAVRARGTSRAVTASLALWPAPPALLSDGLSALASDRVEEAVELLAGRGEGLTPAGDDVLAGYAAWRHADGMPVDLASGASGRSAPLGLAYLRCAERGELPDVAGALMTALRAGDPGAARRRSRALRSWGSTTGPALLWGMAAAAGHRWIPVAEGLALH